MAKRRSKKSSQRQQRTTAVPVRQQPTAADAPREEPGSPGDRLVALFEGIGRTLDTFLYRLVSQAFKRNCAPDGIRIFSFDFSKESWSIPSDMPTGIL